METFALLAMSCELQLQEVAWQQQTEQSFIAPRLRMPTAASMPQQTPLSTLVVLHGFAITVASELQP
jgi:hypothetical protein